MKTNPILPTVFCLMLVLIQNAPGQTHPRLFFDPDAVAGFRAKAEQSPWKDMLEAIEWNLERDHGSGYDNNSPSAHAMAALYLFRGNGTAPRDYAEQARQAVLYNISAPGNDGGLMWANKGYKSLSRAARAFRVAIAYDLCHDAWKGQKIPESVTAPDGKTHAVPKAYVGMDFNEGISKALKDNADSLVAGGGSGWPGNGKTANNWFAVRYSAALLAYLACDEPEDQWKPQYETCLRALRIHLDANLSRKPGANGWNPEGIAYAQYPGYFTYPTAYALNKLKGTDLTKDIPAMRKALWATYQGVLPIERVARTSGPGESRRGWGRGLRPDFTDDHNSWDPEGTAAMAFAFAPEEYKPGLKWMFRRLCGDLGDRTWDSSTGNGLWSLLFYPQDLEEKNPSEVWGNTYTDGSYGVYIMRNRYQDEQDFVLQTHGNLRPNLGGHAGADGLSFRIYGLGVPWCVGSGRTSDPRGQTALFAADPETIGRSRGPVAPNVVDTFFRQNGDGYTILNMGTTETGVTNHTRRIITDYSGESGAPGLFIVSDSSNDGRWWRMNTPDFNTITPGKDGFTIDGPDGQTMAVRVLWPPNPVFRTGTFNRPPNFFYKDVNLTNGDLPYTTKNKWIDFEGNGDGRFVLAITITAKGVEVPAVTATGSGTAQTITAGRRSISIDENNIRVEGWSKPVVRITKPEAGSGIEGGAGGIAVAGEVSDPNGMDRVELRFNGIPVGTAQLNDKGGWSGSVPGAGPGEHLLEAVAIDKKNDRSTASASVVVYQTRPPSVSWDAPAEGETLAYGTEVPLAGGCGDPEGALDRVEVWANDVKLGTAKVEGDRWSYLWMNAKTGVHQMWASAVDKAGDAARTPARTLTVSLPFSKVPRWGDAAYFLVGGQMKESQAARDGPGRWSVVEEDQDLRLKVRPVKSHDYNAHIAWLLGSEEIGKGNWRLSFQFKTGGVLESQPECLVFFGEGVDSPLVLDLRPVNGVKSSSSKAYHEERGTRIWHRLSSGPMPGIAWSHGAVTAPASPGSDHAGIPNTGWNRVRIDRVGKTVTVRVNDRVILEGDHPLLGSRGRIGIGNLRPYGSGGNTIFFDDIDLVALDPTGQPVRDPRT